MCISVTAGLNHLKKIQMLIHLHQRSSTLRKAMFENHRGEGDSRRSWSQRVHESDQALPVLFGELGELVARGLPLAAMPENRLGEVAGAPVMQKQRMAVDHLG